MKCSSSIITAWAMVTSTAAFCFTRTPHTAVTANTTIDQTVTMAWHTQSSSWVGRDGKTSIAWASPTTGSRMETGGCAALQNDMHTTLNAPKRRLSLRHKSPLFANDTRKSRSKPVEKTDATESPPSIPIIMPSPQASMASTPPVAAISGDWLNSFDTISNPSSTNNTSSTTNGPNMDDLTKHLEQVISTVVQEVMRITLDPMNNTVHVMHETLAHLNESSSNVNHNFAVVTDHLHKVWVMVTAFKLSSQILLAALVILVTWRDILKLSKEIWGMCKRFWGRVRA